jgi:hypothetical protein
MGEKFIEFMLKNKPDFFKKISGEGFVDKQVLRHIICDVHKPEAVTMRQFATVITAIIEEISLIPNADVAPVVHGHWENIAKNTIKCSNCGHIRELRHFNEIIKRPVLCEMCGAKMDEEAENEV